MEHEEIIDAPFPETTEERAVFIKKTYSHLAGAVLAFIFVEAFLITNETVLNLWSTLFSFGWIAVIALMFAASWLANKLAFQNSPAKQYAGLAFYVVFEAFIFVPLILAAINYSNGGALLMQAGIITGGLFTALSAIAVFSNKDFSFLKSFLIIGGVVALAAIIAGAIFGFDLGLGFSVLMVLFASASILYETSQLFHKYPVGYHVGAALGLFASLMLLLWYVISIFLNRD